MKTTTFEGKVKATSSKTNPFQTVIHFTLTDFKPNKNKQAIPRSEAENIIRSALNMPIKIFYRKGKENGHMGAYPIGTLSNIWLNEETETIEAESLIWREVYPEEDEYLRKATAEGNLLGTSWEIYFQEAEEQEGISYLQECTFASTVIVDNPAYGERTRIYSIAENMELQRLKDLLKAFSIDQTKIDSITEVEQGLTVLTEYVEAEKSGRATAENQYATLKEQLDQITSQLEEATSKLEQVEKDKLAQAEDNKVKERRDQLASAGLSYSDEEFPRSFVLSLDEDSFAIYVRSLRAVNKSSAEVKEKVPDIKGSALSIKEIAQELKKSGDK